MRCGVNVLSVTPARGEPGFDVDTSHGAFRAQNVVAATGAFQTTVIPPIVPQIPGLTQIHSARYRNPAQLPDGAVLVVGAGASGSQIAEDLLGAGREVYLSVGPHDRPPRSYRGKDFVWWLGVLGKWEMKRPPEGAAHVTIAVSGAKGGRTVDFRRLADDGMKLLGMVEGCTGGVVRIAQDLSENIAKGDANYLSLLAEADAYVAAQGLDLPPEPEAHVIGPDPECLTSPQRSLDLGAAGVRTLVWATGYAQNFDWLRVGALDAQGRPQHERGVSTVEGVYFLGLPWLSMRGSSFIWGVWVDAEHIAGHIAARARNKRVSRIGRGSSLRQPMGSRHECCGRLC